MSDIIAKIKFDGLRLCKNDQILSMAKASYPQLVLNCVKGFSDDKQTFVVEGQQGALILIDENSRIKQEKTKTNNKKKG